MGKKSSLGCQKIMMEKIPKKNHLQVTFSKRPSGRAVQEGKRAVHPLWVEIAIIVFSPAGKAFSFGHSEVDAVIDRFLARRPKLAKPTSACQILNAHRNNNICNLNFVLTQLLNQIDFERKNGEEHEQPKRANEKQVWWELSIDGLGTGELEQLKLATEELRRNVVKQLNMLASDRGSGMPIFGTVDHVHGRMQFQECEEILETKPVDKNGGGAHTFSNYLNFHQDNGIL